MMTRAEARVIAESAALVRPDWLVTSLVSLLAEFRAKDARDVHLALLWVAYDPKTRTPARLREDGPWWRLGQPAHDPLAAPALPPFRPPERAKPAPPEVIAAQRQRLRESLATTQIPERHQEKP